ncbi:uncharacterized protein P884DRAFT_262252 [Thermothelomyces heterothallicus CBS 202.75]|uniref:uncharacterized protein n=1 Tax=Thermothelomyces heterothallicus CBS 202.75 TaxID=1149848 RepID=UPI00374235A5
MRGRGGQIVCSLLPSAGANLAVLTTLFRVFLCCGSLGPRTPFPSPFLSSWGLFFTFSSSWSSLSGSFLFLFSTSQSFDDTL